METTHQPLKKVVGHFYFSIFYSSIAVCVVVHSGHEHTEGVAPLEGLHAKGAVVDENAREVDGLKMVAYLGRDLRLKLAKGAAGKAALFVLHHVLGQIYQLS